MGAVDEPTRLGASSFRYPCKMAEKGSFNGLRGGFLTSVCEYCEILSWFAPDFQDRPTIENVKLLLASDALTTAVLSNGPLSSDSAVIFSRVKISIVIHRNIRSFLRLMVNVEVPVSYELSTSAAGPLRKCNNE